MKKLSIFIFTTTCFFLNAKAQEKAVRGFVPTYTNEEIRIDGILDESIWEYVQLDGHFQQHFPFDSVRAKSRTDVFFTYDDKNLYIAAVCYEAQQGKYIVESLRRDFDTRTTDNFQVIIDPFNDKFNGYLFSVTPYGSMKESLIQFGGSGPLEHSWDNAWYAAATRGVDSYTVEIKIPFKTLRYNKNNPIWRINFARHNLKINEMSVWNPVPMNFPVYSLAYTGEVRWLNSPEKSGVNTAVIPYTLGNTTRDFQAQSPTITRGSAGFDAKFSITSSLNLDITVNPDFSQVDVDQQLTNLTRFSLFFPEQRQFFLENSDIFARFGFSKIRPFFSRRIGLVNGQVIPILGGARLSGKLNKNWRIGAMSIQTGAYSPLNLDAQNYTVAAFQRKVFERSNISFIMINRQGFDGNTIDMGDFNRVVGLDYDLYSANNQWQGKFFYHHSLTPNLRRDSYSHASYLSFSDRKWFIMWNHEYVGKNYRSDVGFIPRQEFFDASENVIRKLSYWRLEPYIARTFFLKGENLYSITTGAYWDFYADSSFSANDVQYRASTDFTFYNTARLSVRFTEQFTRLLFPIDITQTGVTPLPVGGYQYRNAGVSWLSNRRKLLNYELGSSYGSFFVGNRIGLSGVIRYRLQPFAQISLRFTHDYLDFPEPFGNSQLTLIGSTFDITFRTNVFWTTFIQYNTQIDNLNINTRFQWRFKPMSDLFLVYIDNYDSLLSIKNRGIVVKLVYWLGL